MATLSEEIEELKRVEEREREVDRMLAEAREQPKRINAERNERDNTIPPFERITELRRILDQEAALVTRREARNHRVVVRRSLLLIAMLSVAVAALVWWALQVMAGR